MRISTKLLASMPVAALFAAGAFVSAPAVAVQGVDDVEIMDHVGSGTASWYGSKFAGKRTASGERFDPADYTAAHRKLPFGSKVLVTYARTGRSVVVRINDRGPWGGGRIIDLSEAAAAEVGLKNAGHGQVELHLVED